MAESVYKVIELVGTSSEFLGEGSKGRCRTRYKIAQRFAGCRSRGAGPRNRRRQSHRLPQQGESLLQIRAKQRLIRRPAIGPTLRPDVAHREWRPHKKPQSLIRASPPACDRRGSGAPLEYWLGSVPHLMQLDRRSCRPSIVRKRLCSEIMNALRETSIPITAVKFSGQVRSG